MKPVEKTLFTRSDLERRWTRQTVRDALAVGWITPVKKNGAARSYGLFRLSEIGEAEKRIAAGEYPSPPEGWRTSLYHEQSHYVRGDKTICGAKAPKDSWLPDDSIKHKCRVCLGKARR